MRTIVIDITAFDQDDTSRGTRVVYGFRQEDIDDPRTTIDDLINNRRSFRNGEHKAILTEGQNARLRAYSGEQKNYWLPSYGREAVPNQLLAFSFGENPDVNMELADKVEEAIKEHGSLVLVVQWEIANILYERNREYRSKV